METGRVEYTAFDAVKEFHKKSGNYIGLLNEPIATEVGLLRARLIVEEYAEVVTALQDGSIIDIADGLCDLKYVILGTGVSYACAVPDYWGPETHDREDEVQDAQDRLGVIATMTDRGLATLLRDIYFAVGTCCERHPIEENRKALTNSLERYDVVVTNLAALAFNLPFRELFFDVHRSNMSKNLSPSKSAGEKYASGVDPKGPGYMPPRIQEILEGRDPK